MSRFAPSSHASAQMELDAARRSDAHGDAELAFRHLERAHVLGQVSTAAHVRVHWRMFLWAIRHRQAGEAAGQAWRLLALPFSPASAGSRRATPAGPTSAGFGE